MSIRAIRGWSLYDAATSPFSTTTVGAVLPVYFHEVVMPAGGVTFLGATWSAESLWGLLTGTGPLVLLVVLPLLGALADRDRSKIRSLALATFAGATASTALVWSGPGDVWMTAGLFSTATLAAGAAGIFYDGLLNDITDLDTVDRVSARGMAYGFVAGAIHLVASLVLIAVWDDPLATPVAVASTGVWWGGMAVVSLRSMRGIEEGGGNRAEFDSGSVIRNAWASLRRAQQMPDLWKLILAKTLYGNGVQTTVVMTAVFASETLRLDGTIVIVAFLVVQVVSGFSTRAAARVSELIGIRSAMTLALIGWIGAAGAAYLVPSGEVIPFLGLAVGIGLVFGAIATLSRSLFASMIPPGRSAEFFGYESLAARFGVIWGPLAFSAARQTTGSGRLAILTVVVFLVAGLVVFRRVDIEAGRAAARPAPAHTG